jgi:serine/threonine protein kinase
MAEKGSAPISMKTGPTTHQTPPPAGPEEEIPAFFEERSSLKPIRLLARGGMGLVYEAERTGCREFSKRVAVKMLRKKWSENPRFVDLLVAEAKLVSNLVHENIAQMHLLGQLPDGRHYVVMEFVNGISLHQFNDHHRDQDRRVPPSLAIHLVSRIARGLGYAHQFRDRAGTPLHIVHRDVCPRNILITTEGLAKLIDFGVAKARTMSLIGDELQIGKFPYMAPEQYYRQYVDHRADQFALGAVLFELLAGAPMRRFTKAPTADDFSDKAVPWSRLPRSVNKELRGLLKRMLAFDPVDRFEDTHDLARTLEEYIYRDGYGPTIQTVEAYFRQEFPALYDYRLAAAPEAAAGRSAETVPG